MKRVIAGMIVAAALTGCGKGNVVDSAVLPALRDKAMERCEMAVASVASASGLDIEKVCTCAVDRIMAGKSVVDLAQMTRSSPEIREAAQRCVLEQAGNLKMPPNPRETLKALKSVN